MGPPGPTPVPGPGQSECNVPNHLTSPVLGVPSSPRPDPPRLLFFSPATHQGSGQAPPSSRSPAGGRPRNKHVPDPASQCPGPG